MIMTTARISFNVMKADPEDMDKLVWLAQKFEKEIREEFEVTLDFNFNSWQVEENVSVESSLSQEKK